MTGNTRNSGCRPGLILVILGFAALILQGCAGGVVTGSVYTVSGVAAAKLHKKRQAFRENLGKDYANYQALFSSSGCNPEQYQISPKIIEYLEDSAPTDDGYAEAQDILLGIYQDQTLSRNVRAHALYLVALTEAQKEDGSRAQARDYLRLIKSEFPGTHDCAVETLLENGDRFQ